MLCRIRRQSGKDQACPHGSLRWRKSFPTDPHPHLKSLWPLVQNHSVTVTLKRKEFLIDLTFWLSICVISAKLFNLWSVSHLFFLQIQCVYYEMYLLQFSTECLDPHPPPLPYKQCRQDFPHVGHVRYKKNVNIVLLQMAQFILTSFSCFSKMQELLCGLLTTKWNTSCFNRALWLTKPMT